MRRLIYEIDVLKLQIFFFFSQRDLRRRRYVFFSSHLFEFKHIAVACSFRFSENNEALLLVIFGDFDVVLS